uniref:AB hydrolase-1 domain-containing protein n=1 Tax=Chaetoceros debilis TaxID=122233 RepID=A0A7S3PU83_9STRA|mmetsp:Transcript_13948/g.20821  ORF Transcript_13948/g.20821 Transcript_13948/m.20821 type:complete len:434 (-) Transcript_13948:32-1333(-)
MVCLLSRQYLISTGFLSVALLQTCHSAKHDQSHHHYSACNKMQSLKFMSTFVHKVSPRKDLARSLSSALSTQTLSLSSSPLVAKNRNSFPAMRLYSSSIGKGGESKVANGEKKALDIFETPLFQSAPNLLKGLDTFTVPADDDHPLSVYGIKSKDESEIEKSRRPILMLHGRTWSSVPVYHLQGGGNHSRSLMEAMYDAGLQPYAMDFRGFGGTPMDHTKTVVPNRCVEDVEAVLKFVTERHGGSLPTLLGWSQGALVAHLLGQKSYTNAIISKLILYGSIFNPMVTYPRMPLYVNGTDADNGFSRQQNTFNAAIEDFTVEGSIPPNAAVEFAESALLADPFKAEWSYLCQFNNCDPARIHVPTLVVAGDQDPYAPLMVQSELFTNLGRGNDRTWSVIADADHAAHLLDSGKERFLNIVTSFIENSKKGNGKD